MAESLRAGHEQLMPLGSYLRATYSSARRRHGPLATGAALLLLSLSLLPAFVVLAIIRRRRPCANLASEGLSFLLRTFPGSLLTRSHFTWEHLPPDSVDGSALERVGRLVHGLIQLTEDPGEPWVDEERGAPLESRSLHGLLATTRRSEGAWDELVKAPDAEHLIASYDGRMFQVPVGPPGARASAAAITEALREVVSQAPTQSAGPSVLTCWRRRDWWSIRPLLLAHPDNRRALDAIEGALLVVAIDADEGLDPPARRDRESGNRWLDHAIQLVVTPWGAIEAMVDHGVIDGHDYGRLAERLQALQAAPASTASGDAEPIVVSSLRWSLDPAVETAMARARSDLWMEAARMRAGVVVLPELTLDAVRAKSASPDAVCQLILHRGFFLAMGRHPAGEACVIHRRRHAGGRYAIVDVGTAPGDAWMTTGDGLQPAVRALSDKLAAALDGPDAGSTLFALAGLQTPGPMAFRAWVRRVSDGLIMSIGPLATALYPEVTTSNMSGLPALGQVGPVTQRPGGLASAHRIGPDGIRFDLWWTGATADQMDALVEGIRQASSEAAERALTEVD